MNQSQTPVTVVILNWNGKHWLEKFLPSVMATSYPHCEILVVDNASSDESIAFLQSQYPSIQVVALDQNYGFAEGNNQALPHINTPYFVLLNSDVEVAPDWLQALVSRMDSDPLIASVQPKIRSYEHKDHFEYAGAAGGYIDSLGYPYCRGRVFDHLEADTGQYDQAGPIFWATGACCLIRKSVVEEIGLFEPEFFAHMEEIDFCWRAQNFGYKIFYEPGSTVYHVGGGSLPQGNPRKTYLNARNSLSCMMRNLPTAQLLPKIFLRMVLDGVWGVRALLQRDFGTIGAILKAHLHFYQQMGKWLRYRNKMYAGRRLQFPLPGASTYSIVWQYFILRKKRFVELPPL